MPYEMQKNPMTGDAMAEKMNNRFSDVNDCLNQIVTAFKSYEAFNNTAEKCHIKNDLRGLGRFNECMGKRAYCDYACFSKKLADHPYGISTVVDYAMVDKADKWGHYKYDSLMGFLENWKSYLKDMNKLFTDGAYYLSDHKQISLYKDLCCYVGQIENEQWAVGVLIDRLSYDQYQHPDLRSVMKKLHVYFEQHWDGKDIDLDI